MSNKIVPTIYRSIVDDVMQNIRSEFEEFGVANEVLADLQSKWEFKIMSSNVAEFESPTVHAQNQQYMINTMPVLPGPPPPPRYVQPQPPQPPPPSSYVKAEPQDMPPPLAGPPPSLQYPRHGSSNHGLALPPRQDQQLLYPGPPHPSASRMPQLDGPSSSSSDGSQSPSPGPESAPPQPNMNIIDPNSGPRPGEEINSDLDDSDEEEEGADVGGDSVDGNQDIVFCTYDKVQRVKNKWKCVLKDGMTHINGKDYLFSKCNGEFEW